MCNNKIELWLPIANFEGYYEVSNFGNIRSLSRIVLKNDNKKQLYFGKLLKPRINKKRYNYCEVGLKKDGIRKTLKVHRLVAEAFLKNDKNFLQVNHKDFNPLNNHIDNLEWCNAKYNINYSLHRRKDMKGKYGRKIFAFDLKENLIGEYGSVREAARQLNCHGQNICRVLSNKTKQTNGYSFKDYSNQSS